MWRGNSKKIGTDNVETMIGRNTEISGDVIFRGGLYVDGRVNGNINAEEDTDSLLVLNPEGVIEGEVRVPNMVINGQVNGDVHTTEKVVLNNQARIDGDVYYNLLEMEMGAAINGNLVHQNKKEKRLLEYQSKPESNDESKSVAK